MKCVNDVNYYKYCVTIKIIKGMTFVLNLKKNYADSYYFNCTGSCRCYPLVGKYIHTYG